GAQRAARPVSGWGFLGMLRGYSSDDNRKIHEGSDRLSDSGSLCILTGLASQNERATGEDEQFTP
ncbi:MAG: hypothetical protein ABEH81_05435, partial [Halopenitus sp.]